jgi:hypothetical protein
MIKTADCKSAGLRLRWFESITYHHLFFSGEKRILFNICEDIYDATDLEGCGHFMRLLWLPSRSLS